MLQLNIPPSPTRDDYINQQLTPSPASDEKSCPICCDSWETDQIIKTHCGHVFHRECFVAWLGKEDINSANSCPNCRAICFPNMEAEKESGLTLDMSHLYNTMRSEYVNRLPVLASEPTRSRSVNDDMMLRLAFGDEDGAD